MSISHSHKRSTVIVLSTVLLLTIAVATAQRGGNEPGKGMGTPSDDQPPLNADIAKAKSDRQENIKDATRLAQLSNELKQELESGSDFTLSVGSLKKADELERVSKRLYIRMKASNESAPKPPTITDVSKGRN